MQITATHINYYHICRRKLWLFSHGLTMEHTSDAVYEGKLIGTETYSDRAEKYTEVAFEGVKIDFYDAKNRVVHEVKKSAKMEQAHIAQVKYYLYVLHRNGITDAKGIIEYPKQRHTEQVELKTEDWATIEAWLTDIERLCDASTCPKLLHKPVCKNCAYCDFCYADE